MKLPERKDDAMLLGLGTDGAEGETRITRGENFRLLGGSKDTHEAMQEKAVKFNEKLAARGKKLSQLELGEFLDIAQECRMNVVEPKKTE